MLVQPIEWLKKHWWGLIIAHFLILGIVFTFLWQLAEPLGLYDNLNNISAPASSRAFLHINLTLIFGAYLTLALDLFLRWKADKEKTLQERSQNAVKAKILFATDISEHRVPKDSKNRFQIGSPVKIHVTYYGLQPNRQYLSAVEIYHNTEFIDQKQFEFVPSDSTWVTVFHQRLKARTHKLGTHRVHAFLDGEEKGVKNFYVSSPPNSDEPAQNLGTTE